MKTKYAPQIAPTPSWKNAILLAITALALSRSAAFGATTIWTDGTGGWFTTENWGNGVPDSTTDAFINNGGTAQITVDLNALALSLTLGQYAGDSGTVSVSPPHAGLNVGGTIFVGYRGSGTFVINEPGGVTAGASIASLTTGPSVSHGAVTVDGAHASWAISGEADVGGTTSGSGGTGLLTVTNGGTVTAANVHVYSSGTLTGNATVTTTSGMTIDGTLEPSGGGLTIGGSLSFSGTGSLMQCNVVPASADNANVSATATLTGRLKVKMTGTFTPGTTYTLLHADTGRNGTFSSVSINYPTNQCFTPVVTYDANNVYLYLQANCL